MQSYRIVSNALYQMQLCSIVSNTVILICCIVSNANNCVVSNAVYRFYLCCIVPIKAKRQVKPGIKRGG